MPKAREYFFNIIIYNLIILWYSIALHGCEGHRAWREDPVLLLGLEAATSLPWLFIFTFFNFFGSDGTANSSFRLPTRTAPMMRKMSSSPCRRFLLLLLLSKPSLRQTTLIQRAGNSHSNGFRFYSQLAPQRRPGENERSRGLLLSSVDYHIISCSFFRAPSFSIDLV